MEAVLERPADAEPVAECRECSVRVFAAKGFDPPALAGWADGLCPGCARNALRASAVAMTEDEQKELIRGTFIENPELTFRDAAKRTGVDWRRCKSVKSDLVKAGVVPRASKPKRKRLKAKEPTEPKPTPPGPKAEPKAEMPTEPERKPKKPKKSKPRRPTREKTRRRELEADLAVLREMGEADRDAFVKRIAAPYSTARRRLLRLVDVGLAEAEVVRRGRVWKPIYRPAGTD